jgi:hypothetical protein
VRRTTLKQPKVEENGARTDYRFSCVLRVNGEKQRLEREGSTQRSFYEPWLIGGVRVWFDAVGDIFDFLTEHHGQCRPKKHARFAFKDASLRICSEVLNPWCPLPEAGLRIEDCYCGEDCWLGVYNGASAHGGLDINHPRGTPLWVPINLDDQYYFNSLAAGPQQQPLARHPPLARWLAVDTPGAPHDGVDRAGTRTAPGRPAVCLRGWGAAWGRGSQPLRLQGSRRRRYCAARPLDSRLADVYMDLEANQNAVSATGERKDE